MFNFISNLERLKTRFGRFMVSKWPLHKACRSIVLAQHGEELRQLCFSGQRESQSQRRAMVLKDQHLPESVSVPESMLHVCLTRTRNQWDSINVAFLAFSFIERQHVQTCRRSTWASSSGHPAPSQLPFRNARPQEHAVTRHRPLPGSSLPSHPAPRRSLPAKGFEPHDETGSPVGVWKELMFIIS